MSGISRRGLLALGAALWCYEAKAAEFLLTPVGASGAHTIVGQEIRLTGAGQRVTLNLQLRGWTPSLLRTYQAKIESLGYTSGASGVLAPAAVSCPSADLAGNAVCVAALGTGSRCLVPNPPGFLCEAGFINRNNAAWAFFGLTIGTAAVDISSLNYRFASVLENDFESVPDVGATKYGGTLVLNVPAGAQGTFTVGYQPGSGITLMADEDNFEIEPMFVTAARIVIQCATNANCNDNSLCTTDTCNTGTGVCSNTPNFNASTQCCNPATGGLTNLSDGNQCTDDVCNAADGQVTHPNSAALTACGNPANSQCDRPDSCNGAGACLTRLEPSGTACGSATNTTCDGADTCNGAGACQTNIRAAGTPCGSASDTACDNPDSCNGGGLCLVNNEANNTPCSDGLFCTVGERCQSAACTGGTPRDCSDLFTCTDNLCNEGTDSCNNPLQGGKCLIDAVCYLPGELNPVNTCEDCNPPSNATDWSVKTDGSVCNDGDACTGTGRPGIGLDTCTTGVCAGTTDPECNADCAFAVPVIVGVNTSNNTNAGIDDGEASCQPDSNNDVWFKFTANCDGATFMSTTGGVLAPSNDTVLNVYTACPADSGVEIACDDDSGVGLQSALTFLTTGGTTYWIRVAGFEENKGSIVLNIRPVDDCLIDGVCYADGDHNPANDCQACVPEISTTEWSVRPEGSLCGDILDTQCDSPDACDGAGFCEQNHKPDGIVCSDEVPANICTLDFCEGGACTHPPQPVGLACGDQSDTECDDPDICDGGGLCDVHRAGAGVACGSQIDTICDNPDICDGLGACLDNQEIDGAFCSDHDRCTTEDLCFSGICVGVPIVLPPTVLALSSRHIRVTPLAAGEEVPPIALHVTAPVSWPCLDDYIDASLHLVNPSLKVFQTPTEWGTFVLKDLDIFPSSTYQFRSECGDYVSAPSVAATRRFADVDGDGDVDSIDIVLVIDAYKGIFIGASFEEVDLFPCVPNGYIDALDIVMVLDAYKGVPYYCSPPCHP